MFGHWLRLTLLAVVTFNLITSCSPSPPEGPVGPIGGQLPHLALTPSYLADHTVFASGSRQTPVGPAEAGLFRSNDGGISWQIITPKAPLAGTLCKEPLPPNIQIWTLTISPDYGHDHTLFVGLSGCGLLKSVDSGGVWTFANRGLGDGGSAAIQSFAISPTFSTDHALIAGTNFGLYTSVDGGDSWKRAVSYGSYQDERFWSENTWALAFSPAYAKDNTVFAVSLYGLYRSEDGGNSWQEADLGLPDLSRARGRLSVSPNFYQDRTAFLAYSGFLTNVVYRTQDAGHSWQALETKQHPTGPFAIAVTQTGRTLLTFGGRLLESIDYGTSWQDLAPAPPVPLSLEPSPSYATDQVMFLVTTDGIWKTLDGGGHWRQLSKFSP